MSFSDAIGRGPRPARLAALSAAAVLLFGFGLAGSIGAAWGYGLFLIATLSLLAGVVFFAFFTLTGAFETRRLRRLFGTAFWLGGWAYVLAVAALAGHFLHETFEGRMELKWIIFGPLALAALIILDWGLYRALVAKNAPTWQRYGHLISRQAIEPSALRRTLLDEVILHRALFKVSPFRWLRHQLIFWGFGLMFAVEIVAVFVREAWPAFGFTDIWRQGGHPVRLAFDAAYDITGLMVLLGCLLALAYRARVNGTPAQKYTDTPTAIFLLLVVLTGFAIEGMRLAAGGDGTASPLGGLVASLIPESLAQAPPAHEFGWLLHAGLALAFIAYVPIKRLVHSCATPMGRLMTSQKAMLRAKKVRSLKGLLSRQVDR